MMRRFSLSQRLTLLFTVLLLLCATVACAVQLYSSMQYGNAMVQRLSGGLAQQIVQREAILDSQGRVDRSALKPLFDRLMTFNPSVELYVVSPDGDIRPMPPAGAHSAAKIDLAPIQNFLSGTVMPVFGDDPRSQNKKVFSATPLRQDGELKGYLYIILQGKSPTRWRRWLAQSALEYGAVVDAAGGAVWSAGGGAALVLGDAPG